MRAIRLPFGLWLCKDTTRPADHPPQACEQMTRLRLENHDLRLRAAERELYWKTSR